MLTAEESRQRPDHALLFAGGSPVWFRITVRRLTMTLPSLAHPPPVIGRPDSPAAGAPTAW